MAVTDKLKEMVEELRQDLGEVKEQVKQITLPKLPEAGRRGRRIPISA